jgi:MFS family permease
MHNYESLDRPGGFNRVNLLLPLANRNFRLLWTGMTVSLMGDGMFLVAIAWQVYQLSNAPAALSIVGIAMTAPHIAFLLLGGAITDRVERRRVMLLADVGRGMAIGVLALLCLRGAVTLGEIYVLVAIYAVGTAFFGPAFDSIVPDILAGDSLAQANSLDQFIRPLSQRLMGPALGGWLIAVGGAGTAFAVDAATFAFSTGCLLVMRPCTNHKTRNHLSIVSDIKTGLSFVRAHVWLWGTFLAAAFTYLLFMGPAEVLLPFIVKNPLHGSASDLGYVFAAGGIGALGAALIIGQRGLPRRQITSMYLCWALATLAVAGYGLANTSWQVMAASFVFNALETAGTIIWATTKQRLVPSALLGRVSSLDWLISIGLLPLSFGLTGPVAAAIGARATLVGAGVLGAVVTISALLLPGMRATDGATDPQLVGANAPLLSETRVVN